MLGRRKSMEPFRATDPYPHNGTIYSVQPILCLK